MLFFCSEYNLVTLNYKIGTVIDMPSQYSDIVRLQTKVNRTRIQLTLKKS